MVVRSNHIRCTFVPPLFEAGQATASSDLEKISSGGGCTLMLLPNNFHLQNYNPCQT